MLQQINYSSNKIVAIILLAALFLILFADRIILESRVGAYLVFKSMAKAYLDYQTRDFEIIKGQQINLKYTQLDKETAQYILDLAEETYEIVEQQLGTIPFQGRIPIVIYPDNGSLNKSFGWGGEKRAVGVYWAGGIRLLSPYAWISYASDFEEVRESFRRDGPLTHELTHLFVDSQTRGNYTRWLTEGLAQYIEREVTGFTLDQPSPREQKALLPLARLDEYYKLDEKQELVYWQSLRTVEYLINNFGMAKMRQTLVALGEGSAIETVLLNVYEITLEELEEQVKNI